MAGPADVRSQVGRFWDRVSTSERPRRTRWWEIPTIVRHVNRRICGQALDHVGDGLIVRARSALEERGSPLPLSRAISVGGGHGHKEMRLLEAGLVEHVDIYELSEQRIEQGRGRARASGLEGRITFHLDDAFEAVRRPEYDLVHWNNSLHHMLDVDRAVLWSRQVLRPGGLFYMEDYVGPNRFQYDARTRAVASAVRAALPDRLLRNPQHQDELLPRTINNISAARLAEADPSEAPQSDRILGAVRVHFPNAEIVSTGGVIYNLALKDAVANFDEADPGDAARLESLLLLDAVATETMEIQTHYAVALAFKGPEPTPLARVVWQAKLAATDHRPDREVLRRAFRTLVPFRVVRRSLGQVRRRLRR